MKYSLLLVLAYLTFSFPVSAETGESEPVSLSFQKVAAMPFVPIIEEDTFLIDSTNFPK